MMYRILCCEHVCLVVQYLARCSSRIAKCTYIPFSNFLFLFRTLVSPLLCMITCYFANFILLLPTQYTQFFIIHSIVTQQVSSFVLYHESFSVFSTLINLLSLFVRYIVTLISNSKFHQSEFHSYFLWYAQSS